MSRAESHAVGGDGREARCAGGISVCSATAWSQSVRIGVGDCSFFSWMVIVGDVEANSDGIQFIVNFHHLLLFIRCCSV